MYFSTGPGFGPTPAHALEEAILPLWCAAARQILARFDAERPTLPLLRLRQQDRLSETGQRWRQLAAQPQVHIDLVAIV